MKAAYLADSLESCQMMKDLSKYFTKVDLYLKNPDPILKTSSLEEYTLLVDNYNIPAEKNLQTSHHKVVFRSVENKMNFLKNQIFYLNKKSKKRSELSHESSLPVAYQIFDLNSLKDIQFDKVEKKAILTNANGKSEGYQFVFVENQELLASDLRIFDDVFKQKPQANHYLVKFTFKMKTTTELNRKFLFFSDKNLEAMIDNLFICEFEAPGHFHINAWIPKGQVKKKEFIQFYAERLKNMISSKYDFIQVAEFLSIKVNSVSGFFDKVGVVKNQKLMMAIPSFSFWSKNQVDHYFSNVIESKLKKTQKVNEKMNRARSLA